LGQPSYPLPDPFGALFLNRSAYRRSRREHPDSDGIPQEPISRVRFGKIPERSQRSRLKIRQSRGRRAVLDGHNLLDRLCRIIQVYMARLRPYRGKTLDIYELVLRHRDSHNSYRIIFKDSRNIFRRKLVCWYVSSPHTTIITSQCHCHLGVSIWNVFRPIN